MFKIEDGRTSFWQWDLNQRLIVGDNSCGEVHFCNKTGSCSLVCEVYTENRQRFVNVPNVLLQTDATISVFVNVKMGSAEYTKHSEKFMVLPRTKPDDYIYTETELLTYEALDARIKALEDYEPPEQGIDTEAVKEIIKEDRESGAYVLTEAQALPPEKRAQVRANIGAAAVQPKADEKYFNITEYGMASLKPAYRGVGRSASKYSHSDNGVGNVGSKYEELPEMLTIPDTVNGIPVTSLAPGMFAQHHRIKIITIPGTVDEIPDYFIFRSLSIEEVNGCTGVSRLGDRAFYNSNIRKILMPNLLEIKGQNNFQSCYFLQLVDIGNVKKIPEKCFMSCERLLRVNGGSGVTEVGSQAFLCATRLKSAPFIANLTSIGDYGFYRCRVNYPFESHPNKAGFGANSTYAAYNPVDFWTAATPTACETPLCATFNQGDPRWENDTANADPWYRWAGDCCINSEAVAYSILTQDDAVTPLTYLDEVKKVIDTPPNISDQSSWPLYTVQERLTALGYTVSDALFFNNDLQTLYDALASGKLAIAECCNGDVAAEANDSSYHAVLLHGINEDGEVMAHDSAGWCYVVGVYEPITFSMPIQALTKADYRFYIVEKEE